MTTLVVGWDSNVDEFGGRISIAEGDDWDVDVGSLLDRLSVGARIRHDDETWLFEGAGDVVGEVSGSETPCDGDSAGVCGKLEDSTLTVRARRYDTNIGGVVHSCNNAGCEDEFLPALCVSFVIYSAISKSCFWQKHLVVANQDQR